MQEICACYFETNVSPVLKVIQRSQELLKSFMLKIIEELPDHAELGAKLEADYASLQKAVDALRVEHLMLKLDFDKGVAKFPGDHNASALGHKAALNKVKGNEQEAKEEQVEHAGQGTSKGCLSKILRSKLTNAEEENERLRAELDAAMKRLESASAAKALNFEASVDFERLISSETFLSEDTTQDSRRNSHEPCSEPTGQMQEVEQGDPHFVEVCTIARENCDRLLEEAAMVWHDDRGLLTARRGEELVASQQEHGPLSNAMQVEVAMEPKTLRNANMRTALPQKDEGLQQVKLTEMDSPKHPLLKILKLKLTTAEEQNERLEHERDDLSEQLQALKSNDKRRLMWL